MPVEVIKTEWQTIPVELLIQRNAATVPGALTFGDALKLWLEDRAAIESLNAQVAAIQGLQDGER